MKPLLLKYWKQFQSIFWFVPSLMTGAAAALALLAASIIYPASA